MNWKKIFDRSVVDVSLPQETYYTYGDIGKTLLGYQVAVTYRYHGTKQLLFSVDDSKLFLVSRECAYRRAMSFYNKTRAKIDGRQK